MAGLHDGGLPRWPRARTWLASWRRLRRSRKGTPAARHDVRVRPGDLPWRRPRAASRPRRPDAAQTKQQKWGTEFVPTAWVNRRCGGRVLGETQHRDVEGIAGTHTKSPSATRQRYADEFHRTPLESGRPGRIQGARAESSQVHASRSAARAPPLREAFNRHFRTEASNPHFNAPSPRLPQQRLSVVIASPVVPHPSHRAVRTCQPRPMTTGSWSDARHGVGVQGGAEAAGATGRARQANA